jgi:uncharacterized membrane protein
MVASKTKARLVILATFALGALAGALLTNLLNAPQPRSGLRVVDEMVKEVKLNPQQREQVEKILTDTQKQYAEIQKQINPQFTAIRAATRKQIRALLTFEQQALYDEWTRKRDARMERHNKDSGKPKDSDTPINKAAGQNKGQDKQDQDKRDPQEPSKHNDPEE